MVRANLDVVLSMNTDVPLDESLLVFICNAHAKFKGRTLSTKDWEQIRKTGVGEASRPFGRFVYCPVEENKDCALCVQKESNSDPRGNGTSIYVFDDKGDFEDYKRLEKELREYFNMIKRLPIPNNFAGAYSDRP